MTNSSGFLSGSGVQLDPYQMTMRAQMMKAEHEFNSRFVNYEKDFNINSTRMPNKERVLGGSMLSYSEHARRVTGKHRLLSENLPDVSLLRVKAKHIPNGQKPHQLSPLSKTANVEELPEKQPVDTFQRRIVELRSERRTERSGRNTLGEPGHLAMHKHLHVAETGKEELHLNTAIGVSDLATFVKPRRKKRRPVFVLDDDQDETMDHSERHNAQDDTVADTSSEADANVARAERARKRRETRTRHLLNDAIATLQALEESVSNPRSNPVMPSTKKVKRLKFPKANLDAIPENHSEDEVFVEHIPIRKDLAGASHNATIWSEVEHHRQLYKHQFPDQDFAHRHADYNLTSSEPFESGSVRKKYHGSGHSDTSSVPGDNIHIKSRHKPFMTDESMGNYGLGDSRNPDLKRKRLKQHAKARLNKPHRIKFLKEGKG